MLDIHFIRNNVDIIKESARRKKINVDVDVLLALDSQRVKLTMTLSRLRQEQNQHNIYITASAEDPSRRNQLIEEMKVLKKEIQSKEQELEPIMQEWQAIMLQIPNVPDVSVPDGKNDADNVEVFTWGEKPHFDFPIKDHVELMKNLHMVDFDRGTKTHGFRGYFLINAGAELTWALWNYARDFFGKRKFVPVLPPVIVRKQHLYGTGHLPSQADDTFMTQDEDYLAGTAEIPMMAYHADEILTQTELPKRYLAFSPCYRREAGSHSKDIKGLIRVHEFYKLEQLILCEASHEQSVNFFEEVNINFEEFLQSLGLPYRRLLICAGDLGQSKVKQYDVEAWVPSQSAYRELSSASYFHDFQTRRFNIRYRDSAGKIHFAHSINDTAIATPRILVPLVEHYQQADGSVMIPEVLRPYMGGKEVIHMPSDIQS